MPKQKYLFRADRGPDAQPLYAAPSASTSVCSTWYPAGDGNNHLFVSNYVNSVGEYDATTGATINETFVTGLQEIEGLAFIAPVPEPSTFVLAIVGFLGLVVCRQCRRHILVLAMFRPIRTDLASIVPAALLGLVTVLAAAFATRPAEAQVLLVASDNGASPGQVGEYNAVTGATVDANFIPAVGGGMHSLALDGNNHIFVSNGADNTVGEYNATTGATINATFINSGQGLDIPFGMVLDGHNHLFVANYTNGATRPTVGEYDAATGVTINPVFLSSTGAAFPIGLALDKSNHLFVLNNNAGPGIVAEYDATTGAQGPFPFIQQLGSPAGITLDGLNHILVTTGYDSVGMYDATTGATINAAFINGQGLNAPIAVALDGNNHLFVDNALGSSVGEYDATTGATINAALINGQGIGHAEGMVYVAAVPEPSTFVLAGIGVLGLLTCIRQRRRRPPYYSNRAKASVVSRRS